MKQETSSANSQAAFRKSIPRLTTRVFATFSPIHIIYSIYCATYYPKKIIQSLSKSRCVCAMPLEALNKGCWILRTRGSLRRISCIISGFCWLTGDWGLPQIQPLHRDPNVETLDTAMHRENHGSQPLPLSAMIYRCMYIIYYHYIIISYMCTVSFIEHGYS